MKDPKRVAAGQKAAATRWGAKRVVRLDKLTPAQRRLVLALIEALEESKAPRRVDLSTIASKTFSPKINL